MTDEILVNHIKSQRGHNHSITGEMALYIQKNYYKEASQWMGKDGTEWYKVYAENTDSKYCSFMVAPSIHRWRHCNMMEFYGDAIVD